MDSPDQESVVLREPVILSDVALYEIAAMLGNRSAAWHEKNLLPVGLAHGSFDRVKQPKQNDAPKFLVARVFQRQYNLLALQ
jgi:hypothetical protein